MNQPEYRIIDANFNRAREALRVMEDYARFVLDDADLNQQAKNLRHDLCRSIGRLPWKDLLVSRDTPNDVGTTLSTPSEQQRDNLPHIVNAAAKRLTEALRCLEEYTKLDSPDIAIQFESIRYRAYELEKQILLRSSTAQRMKEVCLYVLLTEQYCRLPVLDVASAILAGGADCIQLREKDKTDRQILDLAQKIGVLCHDAGALFIMNDRVDLALSADADGVHLGVDDLTVSQARKIAGQHLIIGKSTHNCTEARQAIDQHPDYIAVGSVFASPTKPNVEQAGVDTIIKVRAISDIPIIAIGGLSVENAGRAVQAGADAVAVCNAVISQNDPENAAKSLKKAILQAKNSKKAI